LPTAECGFQPHFERVTVKVRPQRWRDAVSELLSLQAAYADWLAALPDNLQGSSTVEALEAIVEFDLTDLAGVEPPRGYGRD
jgi:hypothetical protein